MRAFLMGMAALLLLAGWPVLAATQPSATEAALRGRLAQALRPQLSLLTMPKSLSLGQLTTLSGAFLPSGAPTRIAQAGIGNDRLNSYAWAMGVMDNKLYVGTGRYVTTFHPMWESIFGAIDSTSIPPRLPDAPVKPFMAEWLKNGTVIDEAKFLEWRAGSQAEIWCYDMARRRWQRVFRAPFVPAKYTDPTTSEKRFTVAAAMGFRSMETLIDANGGKALYAFTGGITMADERQALMYKSTDGQQWTPVATPTEMGSETRASTVADKMLYVGAGRSVWRTTGISGGTWERVVNLGAKDPYNSGIMSLCSYKGKLFAGTENIRGFQVWCGSGVPGATDWVKVVDAGATDRYNVWGATMKVYRDKLYVASIGLPFLTGTTSVKGFDLIRIAPNAAAAGKFGWECIIGGGQAVSPAPGYENVRGLSGWPSGFGNPMAFYGWSMEVVGNKLYLGTFDASVFLRYLNDYPGTLPIPELEAVRTIAPYMASGADLWETGDGRFWRPVTVNGFGHTDNYGVRTLRNVNGKLAIGMNNPFDGCEVFLLSPTVF